MILTHPKKKSAIAMICLVQLAFISGWLAQSLVIMGVRFGQGIASLSSLIFLLTQSLFPSSPRCAKNMVISVTGKPHHPEW